MSKRYEHAPTETVDVGGTSFATRQPPLQKLSATLRAVAELSVVLRSRLMDTRAVAR